MEPISTLSVAFMEAQGAVRTDATVRKTGLGHGLFVRQFRRRRGIGRCQRSELSQCVGADGNDSMSNKAIPTTRR